MKKYTITALVANKSGVLTRVSGLFARRGFNIESLCVCTTEDEALSRMTIVLNGDDAILAQMTKQLDKLIDVKKIAVADEGNTIYRELLLVKVSAPADKRSEIIEIKEVYKAKIVDLSPETLVLEITGEPNKLDGFVQVIEPYGILEMAHGRYRPLARGELPQRPGRLQRVYLSYRTISRLLRRTDKNKPRPFGGAANFL